MKIILILFCILWFLMVIFAECTINDIPTNNIFIKIIMYFLSVVALFIVIGLPILGILYLIN